MSTPKQTNFLNDFNSPELDEVTAQLMAEKYLLRRLKGAIKDILATAKETDTEFSSAEYLKMAEDLQPDIEIGLRKIAELEKERDQLLELSKEKLPS